jgi:Beta-galactosidase
LASLQGLVAGVILTQWFDVSVVTVIGMRRRQLLRGGAMGLAAMGWGQFKPKWATAAPLPPTEPYYLGTTFSPLQCYYMGLDWRQAFSAIADLGLDRVRLGAYWNVIERQPMGFDFTELDWLLDQCDRRGMAVALALGMKVPRWPEFHFPDWVSLRGDTGAGDRPLDQRSPVVAELALNFVDRVVAHCRSAPALKYWQIENEPFTRLEIAGGRWLSPEFVQREIDLVRSGQRADQKILLTNAIHLPTPKPTEDGPAFQDSLRLADAVGINVYTKVPTGAPGQYLEPTAQFWRTLQDWQGALRSADREAWVAEAQAEPWEPQQLVAMQKLNYPSASPLRLRNLTHQLRDLGYGTILLWGCEYWYWQKQQQQNLWWWQVQQLVEEARSGR